MKYKVTKYPDNSFYVEIIEFSENLTFRINSYEDLWVLNQIKDICDNNNQKVNLTIPCLLDAQADRRFNQYQPHGLKLICKFINDLKFNSVSVFHPHNQEVVEAMIDNSKIINNSKFIEKCLREVNDVILMSTDAGGFKPLMKLCDILNFKGETFSASKSRKYDGEKSKLIQLVDKNDFKGKDIMLVDDICVNGGTFIGLAKLLKERNCGRLYLAISHLTVERPNPELFKVFYSVFTTNSKGLTCVNEKSNVPDNLKVIDLF